MRTSTIESRSLVLTGTDATAAFSDAEPADIVISFLDQPALNMNSMAALTWICLQDGFNSARPA